ncbi:MAG: hypothetical protein ABR928_20275, partial [Terracidiphilus sp.]
MKLLRHRGWLSSKVAPSSGLTFVSRLLACAMLLVLVSSRASAAIHPVPLDPKADSSTCLQCHDDKTKGKAVHSA